ncbi:hypothetical protein [uncultured Methylovirgula sp.]|uniref:hypothetical protein n=1 Tax=uncultured Methylovirgula sp. TaxID=1285960 RepID=UPI0026366D9E|nr:hypothetical protein [uncultured Methylovirgula sp.]
MQTQTGCIGFGQKQDQLEAQAPVLPYCVTVVPDGPLTWTTGGDVPSLSVIMIGPFPGPPPWHAGSLSLKLAQPAVFDAQLAVCVGGGVQLQELPSRAAATSQAQPPRSATACPSPCST